MSKNFSGVKIPEVHNVVEARYPRVELPQWNL